MKIKPFTIWLFSHFEIRFLFVIFAAKNVTVMRSKGWVGYRDCFIFGIRIARVQLTKSWLAGGGG